MDSIIKLRELLVASEAECVDRFIQNMQKVEESTSPPLFFSPFSFSLFFFFGFQFPFYSLSVFPAQVTLFFFF